MLSSHDKSLGQTSVFAEDVSSIEARLSHGGFVGPKGFVRRCWGSINESKVANRMSGERKSLRDGDGIAVSEALR